MGIGAGAVLKNQIVLERELGRGGMGVVWLATHRGLDVQVAIKVLETHGPVSEAERTRFEREARAIAKIDSVHVARVSDFGRTAEGQSFIVMELLRGRDLKHRLEESGPLSIDDATEVVGQVCHALERAHALGIIHRDLKPANVFLLEGARTFIKLLDFGIAKLDCDPSVVLTATDAVVGTPYYMSPEQFVDPRTVDHRTDLWSAAIVAYACLTGTLPFFGDTVGALALVVHEGKFVPPSTHEPRVPPALDDWFKRALHPDRQRRFQSARELAATFAEAARDPRARATSSARAAAPLQSSAPTVAISAERARTASGRGRGRRGLFAGAALAIAMGAGAAAWFAVPRRKVKPAPKPVASAPGCPLSAGVPGGPLADAGAGAVTECESACKAGSADACIAAGDVLAAATPLRDDMRALGAYRLGCDAGSSRACGLTGLFLARARGAPKDLAGAAGLYKRGCDAGDPASCSRLAKAYATGLGVPRNPALAASMRTGGCDRGVLADCAGLAELHVYGLGVPRNPARAAELSKRACDGDDSLGCVILAELYAGGLGVAQDTTKAIELARRACDRGESRGCAIATHDPRFNEIGETELAKIDSRCAMHEPEACLALGFRYFEGRGVPKDERRAVLYFQTSCDVDDPLGCWNLGRLYWFGSGVPRDPARAVVLYRGACEQTGLTGCFELADAYEQGVGVAMDPKAAASLYRQACDKDEPGGCGRLGLLFESGSGVEADDKRAFDLYHRGCAIGGPDSCQAEGRMLARGKGTAKDERRAAELFAKACDQGVATSCRDLAVVYREGRGVAKDGARASALFDRACKAGDKEACGAR